MERLDGHLTLQISGQTQQEQKHVMISECPTVLLTHASVVRTVKAKTQRRPSTQVRRRRTLLISWWTPLGPNLQHTSGEFGCCCPKDPACCIFRMVYLWPDYSGQKLTWVPDKGLNIRSIRNSMFFVRLQMCRTSVVMTSKAEIDVTHAAFCLLTLEVTGVTWSFFQSEYKSLFHL